MNSVRVRIASSRLPWLVRRARPSLRKPLVWYRHRNIRSKDVVLAEYPKSGSTWLAFMLAEIATGHPVGFDTQGQLVPGIGVHSGAVPMLPQQGRLLRSHEPYRHEYRKVIYLVRHPADVVVSYYHHRRKAGADFDLFFRDFLRGEVDGYGAWQDHVASFLGASNANVLLVKFEDLRRTPVATLARIGEFLEMDFDSERISAAVANNSVVEMRKKEQAVRSTYFARRDPHQAFVRKGEVGDSLNWLSDSDFRSLARYAGKEMLVLGYEPRASSAC